MNTRAGLWIDHQKAVIVAVTEQGEEMRRVTSGVQRPLRPRGGARAGAAQGPREAAPDDRRERGFRGRLNAFFDEVISCLHDAKSILILGPGEAKRELKQRIDGARSHGRAVGVEPADRLTDRQIVARVRRWFQVSVRKPRIKRRGGSFRWGRTSRIQPPVEEFARTV